MALKFNLLKGGDTASEKKKESKKEPSKGGELNEILAAIAASKGNHVVVSGDSIPVVKRMPTGIFELDFYLNGGFPCGRYSIIYGPESSNKTNICLKAVAQAQRLPGPCNKAVWVNLEGTFDPVWAAKLGVDVANLIVVNPGYGEEAVDLTDALVRAEDVAILVVDSMATLVANKELDKSVEVSDMGTSSMLIKRMVNKLTYALAEEARREHFPCVLLVNQIRYKLGVMFGDPETMPGGEAQKFLCSLRIRTYAKNIVDSSTNTLTHKETSVIVKKSKIPVRAINFKFSLCMSPDGNLGIGDTDSFGMVKGYLTSLGLLEKGSKGYMVHGISTPFPTLGAIQDRYYSDKSFCSQLQSLVLEACQEVVLVDEPSGVPADSTPGEASPA